MSKVNNVSLGDYNIYVGNSGTNTISHIHDSEVKSTIAVASNPVAMLQVSDEHHKYLYVFCVNGYVSIVNLSQNKVVKNLLVKGYIKNCDGCNIAISSDKTTIYVTNGSFDPEENGWVSVIDTKNHTITESTTVGVDPTSIVLTSDNKKLYVTNNGSNTLSIIYLNSKKKNKSLELQGANPNNLLITPDNKHFIVGYQNIDYFQVGAIDTDELLHTINTKEAKISYFSTSIDKKLLFACGKSSEISDESKTEHKSIMQIYDITKDFHYHQRLALTLTEATPRKIIQCTVSQNISTLYISLVSLYDGTANLFKLNRIAKSNKYEVVHKKSLEHFKGFFEITPDEKYLTSLNQTSNSFSYLDINTFEIIKTIEVGIYPDLFLIVR